MNSLRPRIPWNIHVALLLTVLTVGVYGAKWSPNIILMIADDMGYGDLGCYGNATLRTPHIDGLARDGVKLTHALAAADMCTPSRAALLTGRYPQRSGMSGSGQVRVIQWTAQPRGLPPSEITFAELTRQAGYQNGFIGKWHLGASAETLGDHVHHPLNQGFDYYYGCLLSNLDDFGFDGIKVANILWPEFPWHLLVTWAVTASSLCCLYRAGYLNLPVTLILVLLWAVPWLYTYFIFNHLAMLSSMLHRNHDLVEQPIQLVGLSKRFVHEGNDFMSRSVANHAPFFLVMSWFHPHTSLKVSEEFRGRSQFGCYGDAVEEMDWSVGRVLERVEELGERENTLVMFISDHGAHLEIGRHGGSNGIFRGGKTHGAPEGAIRVPWLIRWPGVVPSGVTIDEPVSLMDILPVVAQAAGVAIPTDRTIDGRDILPLVRGHEQVSPHEFLFHYCGEMLHATRYRPRTGTSVWKLVYYIPKYLPGKEQCRLACDCHQATRVHPPALHDIRADPRELAPVDPESDLYTSIVATIREGVEVHTRTLQKVEPQLRPWDTLWTYRLQECCTGPFPFNCECSDSKFSKDMSMYT